MKYQPITQETLVTIIFNIQQDGISLQDKFEWDLSEKQNNPHEFS